VTDRTLWLLRSRVCVTRETPVGSRCDHPATSVRQR